MSEITLTFQPSLAELGRKFTNINVNGFLQTKIKEIAFRAEAEAKKVAPVKTGMLRASIRNMPPMRPLEQIVQTNVYYAIFVHEGTRYMAGRPFMYWGAQSAAAGMEERLARDLDDLIGRNIR